MKFKYIGDRGHLVAFGHAFEHGVTVDIDENEVAYKTQHPDPTQRKTALVVDKLKGHSDFKEVTVGRPPKEKDDAQVGTG